MLLPKLGDMSMKDISRKDIISAINPLLGDEKLETADRVLSILNGFFKYALLHEYVDHNIIADIDKKTLLGRREVRHFAYLKNDDEIRAVLMAIKDYFGDLRVKTCAIFSTIHRSKRAKC